MTHDEFRALVSKMRDVQRRWFKGRLPQALEDSKALERQVDRALAEFAEPPSLFDRIEEVDPIPSRTTFIAEIDETA
jgi:hypothetical protein